jgi:hypothetical protein
VLLLTKLARIRAYVDHIHSQLIAHLIDFIMHKFFSLEGVGKRGKALAVCR